MLNDQSYQFLDRGYWSKPISPSLSENRQNVIICHSLGLHYCTPWLGKIDQLVIISGFEHFHGSTTGGNSFTRKHLQRMKRRMKNDPNALLTDFYRDCEFPGLPPINSLSNPKLLTEDLDLLDCNFVDLENLRKIPKILLLHGANDRIVCRARAEELQAKLQGSVLKIIPEAGHGLPFTHTTVCWQAIKAFI